MDIGFKFRKVGNKYMIKIDIVSGFLGAGKTTLIKKLLKEALGDTKVVLIENEFGEIGIDSGFLKEAGIEIKEMNSGCICCSLVGDFGTSLQEVIQTYHPERVLIEPSGVGKLSDVRKAVEDVAGRMDVQVNSAVAVVDALKCKMYIKNFGEFFCNQIAYAGTIILSRTADMPHEKLESVVAMIRQYNESATIITTPWEELKGTDILSAIEGVGRLEDMMQEMLEEEEHKHHHDEECEHEHHYDGECSCGHHHDHHHDHGESCSCGCHDHDHHHHADEVFTSWGKETPAIYSREEIENILKNLQEEENFGTVLRAKGMAPTQEGTWIYFDLVPGEVDIREGKPEVTGKVCVIGTKLQEERLATLFK